MSDNKVIRPRISDAEWSFLRSFPGSAIAMANTATPEFYRVPSMDHEPGPHGHRISTTISTVLGLVAKGYVEMVPNAKYTLYVRHTELGREELQRAGVSMEPPAEATPTRAIAAPTNEVEANSQTDTVRLG